MNINANFIKSLVVTASLALMSTNAYCRKMGFYNLIAKLDVNPAAIKQLDIPNPRSASTAATYRRALDPNSGLFKNIAKSVGYTGELTKGQIDEVTQVAFAYRYVDGITNAIGGQALLTSLAEKVSKATNKQDIYKIVSGNLQIKYSSIQDYVYTYNRDCDALSYKKLKANEVWQSTYAKLVDDVETTEQQTLHSCLKLNWKTLERS